MIEEKIINCLLNEGGKNFGFEILEQQIQFQKTRKDVKGDLTLVVFPFVKKLKCAPQEAGNKIGTLLSSSIPEIESFESIHGFLNISLVDQIWINKTNEILNNKNFGFKKENSKGLIMVEYSSPNTNKPLHLGHLRNIFLGCSISEILKANGHKVIRTQIINDRGIHICKSMIAWRKFAPTLKNGEKENPFNSGMKGDKLVGKYYVEFERQLKIESEEIINDWKNNKFNGFETKLIEQVKSILNSNEENKLIELARNNTSLMSEAKRLLILWEARDPEIYLLWETMNAWVYKGFEESYKKMEVEFDQYYYESQTYQIGKDIVLNGLSKNQFFKKEDGSIWINLEDEKKDNKLLLRSDGTSVYMTQDIGTAIERFNDFPEIEGMVYTVGNEQDYHFNVLFSILKKLGYKWAENCTHLSYGMVDLPSGKMKSREGTVVDADELIEEVTSKAAQSSMQRGHLDDMSIDEKEKLYHTIGMGGLKYYLLKVDPKKRMMFNPEESIELTGNTGPFIQYTFARIQSLLNKGDYNINSDLPSSILKEEKDVIKCLVNFPEIIKDAGSNFSPAIIANYLYELVKEYNHFYQSIPINKEKNVIKRNFRMTMSYCVADAISKGMSLLGIKVPNQM